MSCVNEMHVKYQQYTSTRFYYCNECVQIIIQLSYILYIYHFIVFKYFYVRNAIIYIHIKITNISESSLVCMYNMYMLYKTFIAMKIFQVLALSDVSVRNISVYYFLFQVSFSFCLFSKEKYFCFIFIKLNVYIYKLTHALHVY